MNQLSRPVSALVDAATWFPEAFRPGAFGVALISLVWLIVTRGSRIWGFACRTLAVGVDLVIGCLLLPDYVVTSARRRSGGAPGTGTLVAGQVLDRVLDGAAGLYTRHSTMPSRQRTQAFPWKWAAVVLLVPVAAWVLRDQAPDSAAAEWVTRMWAYWIDLETWAAGQ